MENRVSFVDFLTRFKYRMIVSIAIALFIVSSVLVYMYNREQYNEKASTLLETTTNDYEAFIEKIQKSDENTKEINDKNDESSKLKNEFPHEAILKSLNKIIETYPTSFASQKALVQSGVIWMYLKQYKKARDRFLVAATKRRKTYITPIAYLHAAISQENIDIVSGDNSTKAKEYYQHIIDIYPKNIVAAHAYFSLGRLSEQDITKSLTAKSSARSYYKTLVENDQFRDSSWTSLAQSRLIVLDSQRK